MISKKILLFFLILSCNQLFSQYRQLGPDAEISILTIGPGNSLNDSFGHSAFRVKNTAFDIIFNYGVFDFEAPNFYLNFAQGKLNYKVEAAPYNAFKNWYIQQNRTIEEQILNLSVSEKQLVFNYLATNAEPENSFYLYDFFYDNCATKMRDVLKDALPSNISFEIPKDLEEQSFRDLIAKNLNWNSWGSFGIDVALGSIIDKRATPYEYMFLPDYIFTFFADAKIGDKPLVKNTKTVYQSPIKRTRSNFLLSPLLILGVISLFILYITYKDVKGNKRTKWLDIVLFAVTGLIGFVLLLLWFATDHTATAFNYNLLWAFAINLLVIKQVILTIPKKWFTRYVKFLIIMLVLMAFHWVIGLQVFALALIPLLIALLVRYVFLVRCFNASTIDL